MAQLTGTNGTLRIGDEEFKFKRFEFGCTAVVEQPPVAVPPLTGRTFAMEIAGYGWLLPCIFTVDFYGLPYALNGMCNVPCTRAYLESPVDDSKFYLFLVSEDGATLTKVRKATNQQAARKWVMHGE